MKFIAEYLNVLASCAGYLLPAAGKGFVMLALVFATMPFWRRSSAAARHLAWTITFLCLLGLPVFLECRPAWHAPGWLGSSSLINQLPDSVSFVLGNEKHKNLDPSPAISQTTAGAQNPAGASRPAVAGKFAISLRGVVVVAWFAGAMLGLARLLVIQIRLKRMADGMRECESEEQLKLLEDLRAEYRIRRPVRLLVSDASASPMTWGFGRPVIALPADSRHWDFERLRVVLRHELAHVKRWDCLTQELAGLVCAVYWFNPLTWLAAGRMRVERERACDDFVLNAGACPAEYAGHLVEIARQFATGNLEGAVAMARPSGLEQRVVAILDGRRNRSRIAKMTAAFIVLPIAVMVWLIGGWSKTSFAGTWSLEKSGVSAQLKSFVAEKVAQADAAAKAGGPEAPREFKSFFAAAAKGDWLTVSNIFEDLRKRAPHYAGNEKKDVRLQGIAWEGVKETWGALYFFNVADEKYSTIFANGIIESIPPGSIYFGGTDPGRFLVTTMQKSQVNGDPFFTLTQNALADSTYLDYLRAMYGQKIQLLTDSELTRGFQEYMKDIQKRYTHDTDPALKNEPRQMKSGEAPTVGTNGILTVSGQVSVMAINGRLVKTIFDKNPDREFYLEESFPLEWMYPYLEPHSLIFKIDRQPVAELPGDIVQRDHDYWIKLVQPMIGDWLNADTTVAECAAFAQKVHIRHDLGGFQGDPEFIQSSDAQKMFSKLRSSLAGLYAWRVGALGNVSTPQEYLPKSDEERQRMIKEADFTYRQAWVLCPYSPEAVFRYVQFLTGQNRDADALLVAETAAKMPELDVELKLPMRGGQDTKEQLRLLVEQLKQSQNKR